MGPGALWLAALVVFVVNLPFGFWRAGLRKLSVPWFVAVHAPVPLAVGVRLASGLGWRAATIPVMAAAYFAGQLAGGRARSWWRSRTAA